MTDPLTIGRFRDLADAYGGVVARWPERYRQDAMLLASRPEAIAILADAAALDGVMDAWRVPIAPRDLADRIAAMAPRPSPQVIRRLRLWWSGIGIATALAGAVAGTATVMIAAPTEAIGGGTSFGDITAQGG